MAMRNSCKELVMPMEKHQPHGRLPGRGYCPQHLPGPMPLIGGALTLNHSQVTGNTAAHGRGIFNNGGTVTLAATSVTGNHPDNCEPPGTIAACTG